MINPQNSVRLKYSVRSSLLTLAIAFAPSLWAGIHYPAKPGEIVVPNQYLVKFVPGVSPQEVGLSALPGRNWRHLTPTVSVVDALDPATVDMIANHPLVEYIEPNRIRKANLDAVNDSGFQLQWALPIMHAVQAWQLVPGHFLTAATPEAGRLKVAILDTGVDCTHPDFMNAGGTSTDSAHGGQLSFALSQALVQTTISPAACPWQDDHYHGTATAGIIAAAAQNGIGAAGLGYPVELIVYKIAGADGFSDDGTLANAIQKATDVGARIISISFAGQGFSQTLQASINYAWQHDVLVVAAAGNSASSVPYSPAAANYAIGVGAVDGSLAVAGFSNYGNDLDVVAPGAGIYSLAPTNGSGLQNYAFLTGTSASTPIVAAIAGLIATGNPGVPAAAMRQRIQQSANSYVANGGWDQHAGYGIVDAYNAVSGTIRPSTLGSLDGQVQNTNGVAISNTQVTVNGTTVVPDSSGRFRVPNLPPGTYTVNASGLGYPGQALTATVVAGADSVLPIVLGASYAQFSGIVTDGFSSPVAGAVVQALFGGLIQATTFSDANGQYSLWVSEPGAYDIRVAQIGSATATVPAQTVSTSGNTRVNLTLGKLGSVSGVVVDTSQSPLANAQLVLSSGNFSVGAITDAHGSYSTLGVPAGIYSLAVTALNQPNTTVPGIVVSTGITGINVQMGSAPPSQVVVSVSPPSVTIQAGQTVQFSASVTSASNPAVTWSVSPKIGTLSATGMFQAPATVPSNTTVQVTATSVADPTKSASAIVNVTAAPQISVSVNPATVNLTASKPQQFTASVTGTSNAAVTWSMSPQAGQLSAAGWYTAPSSITSPQAITITATSVADTSKSASAVVNLQASAPVINTFAAAVSNLTAGQSTTLSWNVTGATSVTLSGTGTVAATGSTTVSPSLSTTYTLTASNATGNSSAQVVITVTAPVDNQPPSIPALTSAVAKSATEVDLSWTASTDNVGVAGYQILRNGSVLASAVGLAYADTSVSPNTPYTYGIKAFDAAGNYSALSNTILVTTPAPPPVLTCPGPGIGVFTGCYYNNTDLTGNPVLVRTDNQINFTWGTGSPSSAVTPLNFSARWQGVFNFTQGDYTFTASISDGMRLYIDGLPVKFTWRDQGVSLYVIPQTLSQGNHLLTLEYYEHTGTATALLSWNSPNPPPGQLPAISAFTATPSTLTAGHSASLSWNVTGATSVTLSGTGNVSAAGSATVAPSQTTTYTLTASNTAGSATAQVTVTVTASVDQQPPTTPTLVSVLPKSAAEVDLGWTASTDNVGVAGYQIFRNGALLGSVAGASLAYADTSVNPNTAYTYAIKAFDAAGNYSSLSNSVQVSTPPAPPVSACPGPAIGAFTGCYYNNTDLTGNPVLVRTDNQINFYWGSGSPSNAVMPLNFSARWQGIFNFAQGNYTFIASMSDGMRLYIDGNPVRFAWRDQGVSLYLLPQTLSQGNHLITLEYYEHTGTATAVFSWQQN